MWKIASWLSEEKRGTVQGEHLGPLSFDAAKTETLDYQPGEEVLVEVEETRDGWRVKRVVPMTARQPSGTNVREFDAVNEKKAWDFQVHSLADDVLTIFGSYDFAYHHDVELRFHSVKFVSCQTYFSHALFRAASADEIERLRAVTEIDRNVYCIVTEHGSGPDGSSYFVTAERVECSVGTVYYYKRDNLKAGERIAPWVTSEDKQ